jgi:hypothetical protein
MFSLVSMPVMRGTLLALLMHLITPVCQISPIVVP